ncbi:MAG: deoxynucleoside kinase [Gemmatimonadaceae bacterium]|nr:deoxynucleoside kinase [Actinomycetota bacterium]
MFIAIEGCMASGKSSTAQLVSDELGITLVKEQSSGHPFLAQFYANPGLFALETELAFALIHYHQLHQLAGAAMVSDFSPVKDLVFAEMNLSGEELQMFRQLYQMLAGRVPLPDIVVFLDLPVDECKRRCIARGRPYEANISLEYLSALRDEYRRHMSELGKEVHLVEVAVGQRQRSVAEAVLEKVFQSPYLAADLRSRLGKDQTR